MTTPPPSPGTPSRTPRWALWLVLAVTLFAALWRFPFLTAEDLWFDEVFSVVLASQDLGELMRRAIGDQTNPPGFYLVLWGWMHAGAVHESWIRALPALAGTLTVPAVIALGRALGMSVRAALLGGLLTAVSPLLVEMSLEVRAYAPLALLAALSLALGVRMAAQRGTGPARGRLAVVVADIALVSLHYFGALVVFARVSAAFASSHAEDPTRRRLVRRDALVTALPAALVLVTWFVLVLASATGDRVGGNADWIGAAGTAELLGFGSIVLGTFGSTIGAWSVAAILIAATVAAGRRERAAWRIVPAILPLIVVLLVGALTGRSVWVGRYLVVVLPAFMLLLADFADAIATKLPSPWRVAPLALLAAWAVAAGAVAVSDAPRKPPWSLIVPAIAAGGPVTVCVNEAFVGLPLQYHALRTGAPITVADMTLCESERTPGWVLLRNGTEASLAGVRLQGARVGNARDLGTELPPVILLRLEWPTP